MSSIAFPEIAILRARHLAVIFGVKHSAVHMRMRAGTIPQPTHRIGNTLGWRRDVIEDFVEHGNFETDAA